MQRKQPSEILHTAFCYFTHIIMALITLHHYFTINHLYFLIDACYNSLKIKMCIRKLIEIFSFKIKLYLFDLEMYRTASDLHFESRSFQQLDNSPHLPMNVELPQISQCS